MERAEFTKATKDVLAKRVGYCCSNPTCKSPTTGPHTDATRSVNIGVACHIYAAAPGGPRDDSSISREQRSEMSNAIWLCQSCAKLIDNDVFKYSPQILLGWKTEAECRAQQGIAGEAPTHLFPQPISALHSSIPKIAGLPYVRARELLVNAGWQPFLHSWTFASDIAIKYGNGPGFWEMGFWEISQASPTGLAHCIFEFKDVYGNRLRVVTMGEELPDRGARASVTSWQFVDDVNDAM